MSKNKYLKVAAELDSNKEAYGGQKQALNIWLALKTTKIKIFNICKNICSVD